MPQSISKEIGIKIPLEQLWEAFKDLHNLLPRLLPGFVEKSAIIVGDGGVGSIRELKFSEGVPGISSSKEEFEDIDEEKHVFTYKVLESEILEDFSSYRVTWKFRPQVTGSGTDVTWRAEFVPVKEGASPDRFRDSAYLLMRQLEGHLMVTHEYTQPSLKDTMREELLA